MDLVEKVKVIRKHYKMSQEEFAKELGISRSNYSNIEQRRVKPTSRLINCVSVLFHVDKEWLLDDSRDDLKILEDTAEFEFVEKYRKLKGNYKIFAEEQIDKILELQEKEVSVSGKDSNH